MDDNLPKDKMSGRLKNILNKHDIDKYSKALNLTREEFRDFRGAGANTENELEFILSQHPEYIRSVFHKSPTRENIYQKTILQNQKWIETSKRKIELEQKKIKQYEELIERINQGSTPWGY